MHRPDTRLPNWLTRCAENFPQHVAISCGPIRWTFAELHQQAIQFAHQLAHLGVHEGSRVAMLASNGLPYVVSVHALTRLGAILVPLNTRLTLDELCWQIQDVHAALLLHDEHYASTALDISRQISDLRHARIGLDASHIAVIERLPTLPRSDQPLSLSPVASANHDEGLPQQPQGLVATREWVASATPLRDFIDLDDTQAILYTSGTTGKPKGVIITYGMQWWNAIGSALNLGHHTDDCWLACLPLFHIGGLSILMRSVINGISVNVHAKFDPQAINLAIREERVTIISVVAVMLQRMLAALDAEETDGHYPPTLRCVLLGGGPAPSPLLEACASRNIPVVQTYGLTESCSQAVTLAPADALRKLGSAGRPLLPVQLRITNDDQPVPAGEPGVICLKGPSITPGYADRPDDTAHAFRDGWLSTGDLGYLDAEGYLYVLDRRNDLIISGGENVYPAEIEAVLLAHPEVEEAGVCGQNDAQWGQIPVAFVRLRGKHTTGVSELQAHAAQHLARYKQPRMIYLVDQLPRNAAGKLLRRELPRLLEEHSHKNTLGDLP